jgi:hypothetical protein
MGGLFGAPQMLWWAAAAAVPILIHLFARQRFKRVAWGAMEFLRRAFKKTQRRVRLEHLLILLLRILALVLLALALAEPLRDVTGLISGQRRELVLILDDSFSMGAQEADGATPFAHARARAAEETSELRGDRGDSVSLILASRPVRVLRKASTELDRTATEIGRLEVRDSATDLSGALSAAAGLVESLPEGAEVVVLSDLQRTAFGDAKNEAAVRDLGVAARAIAAKKGVLRFVMPRQGVSENLALSSMICRDRSVIAGRATRVAAVITNFGDSPQAGSVSFHADGAAAPFETREFDALKPGASESVDVRITFPTPGSHVVEARFSTDALAVDNRRALSLDVRGGIKVLVVDGEPSDEAGETESWFLTAALDPGIEGVRPPFEVNVVPEARFDTAAIANTDLVVLMNTSGPRPDVAAALRQHVNEGGALWILPGDRSEPETLNTLLFQEGLGPLPLSFASAPLPAADSGSKRMLVPQPMPAELAYFADPEVAAWLPRAPIHRLWPLQLPIPTGTRVLLEAASPTDATARFPALAVKNFGRGRVALTAFPGDQEWTDLPSFPTFVLLAREVAWWLTARENATADWAVGSIWTRRLKGPVKEALLSRGDAASSVLRPQREENSEARAVVSDPLESAGLWRVDFVPEDQQPLQETTPRWIAVNVDPVDSDLHRVDAAWLRSSFGADVDLVDSTASGGKTPATAAEHAWWWLLAGALLALVLETALAQWFGARAESRS